MKIVQYYVVNFCVPGSIIYFSNKLMDLHQVFHRQLQLHWLIPPHYFYIN